jgi:hypothetical protein
MQRSMSYLHFSKVGFVSVAAFKNLINVLIFIEYCQSFYSSILAVFWYNDVEMKSKANH